MISGFEGKWRFLSNFYPSAITHGGIVFPSVEHAYQAAKSSDPEYRERVANLKTPGQAKRAGRQAILVPHWDDGVKVEVMRVLLRRKFAEGTTLARMLVETAPHTLIETNYWHDQFWGDCTCDKHRLTEGENMLGRLLMDRREELIKEGY